MCWVFPFSLWFRHPSGETASWDCHCVVDVGLKCLWLEERLVGRFIGRSGSFRSFVLAECWYFGAFIVIKKVFYPSTILFNLWYFILILVSAFFSISIKWNLFLLWMKNEFLKLISFFFHFLSLSKTLKLNFSFCKVLSSVSVERYLVWSGSVKLEIWYSARMWVAWRVACRNFKC